MTHALSVIRTFDRSHWLCLASLMAAVCALPFWATFLGKI